MVLLLAAAECCAGNLVRNGRFEGAVAGNVPESWSFHDFRTDKLASGSVATRGGFVGPQCLELKAPAFPADFACYSRPVDVSSLGNSELIFSCYFRTEEHPQAVVTLGTYAEDFTRREFETPALQGETYYVGEAKEWTLFATRLRPRPGSRDLVVMLRVMGGGTVWWDGVSLRPVDTEVAVDLERAGTVVKLPSGRAVSCQVRNCTEAPLPVRLNLEVIPEEGKRKSDSVTVTLPPGQRQRLEIGYNADLRAPHRLRVMVLGRDPDDVYQHYDLSVPGLVHAEVVEPAFRATLLSTVPTAAVVVEGQLNTTPEIARQTTLRAELVGTGAYTDQLEFLSPSGLAGPWRLRLPAEGMLTDDYQVQVRAKVGKVEQVLSLPLSRARHSTTEVAYDSARRLYVHGTPLFPIGLHRVTNAADLATVREAGFNFVITPSRSSSYAYVDAVRAAGLLMLLGSSTLESKFWENMVDKYHTHQAFMGYYGLETPDVAGATAQLLSEVYIRAADKAFPAIAQMDAHHPVVLLLRPNSTLPDYAAACDIALVQCDPVPRWPLTAVAEAVEQAIAAVKGRKPVWAAIQSVGLAWQEGSRRDAHTTGRPPTAAEHRAMTFLALIAGADGLVDYSWSLPFMAGIPSYSLPRDAPELWEGIKLTNMQLAWLAPVLSAAHPRPVQAPEDCPLRMAAWQYEGMEYIVAVNPTEDTLALSFNPGAAPRQELEVLFEQRKLLATDDGRVGDAFQPFEVHIYARKL